MLASGCFASIARWRVALREGPLLASQLLRNFSSGTQSTEPEKVKQPAGLTTSQTTTAWPPPAVHWIESSVPKAVLPYVHLARLHKPIGTWLFLWPCLWAATLATPPGAMPDFATMGLLAAGAAVRFV